MSVKSHSKVWDYFKVSERDDSKVLCIICNEVLSRGGACKRSYTTTTMIKHLERKHTDAYRFVRTSIGKSTGVDSHQQTGKLPAGELCIELEITSN